MKPTEPAVSGPGSRESALSQPQPRRVRCPLVVLRVTESQALSDDLLADAVRDELLARYQHSGAVHVIVDLEQVSFLTSAGIRSLLGLLPAVRERKGRLLLCNLDHAVAEVLVVTRLIVSNRGRPAPFEQHADVPGAVASLYQPAS
jgi:anti-anti-sigma factor